MPSKTPELLTGELMQWDHQMNAWVIVMLKTGAYAADRRLKMGITAEKLLERGMPVSDISPHTC